MRYIYTGPGGIDPQTPEEAMRLEIDDLRGIVSRYRSTHKECVDLTGHPDALPSQRKDWRCDLCKRVDEVSQPPQGEVE